jgi:hypothetical protein
MIPMMPDLAVREVTLSFLKTNSLRRRNRRLPIMEVVLLLILARRANPT